jgi:hypothetical protein
LKLISEKIRESQIGNKNRVCSKQTDSYTMQHHMTEKHITGKHITEDFLVIMQHHMTAHIGKVIPEVGSTSKKFEILKQPH